MATFEVIFYETEDGETPVEDFLNSLSLKQRSKVMNDIDYLEEMGTQLREPKSKKLTDKIFELRSIQGRHKIRTLYFFFFNGKIVLTNGFLKKTRKTPKHEIELATKRRADFLAREEKRNENIPGI